MELLINARVLTDSHEFICSLSGLTRAFYHGPSRANALMGRSLSVEGTSIGPLSQLKGKRLAGTPARGYFL